MKGIAFQNVVLINHTTRNFCSKTKKLHNIQKYREFFDNLAKQLHIKRMEDWYQVKFDSIAKGIGGIAYSFGGPIRGMLFSVVVVMQALMLAYPEYPWRVSLFGVSVRDRDPKWKVFPCLQEITSRDYRNAKVFF